MFIYPWLLSREVNLLLHTHMLWKGNQYIHLEMPEQSCHPGLDVFNEAIAAAEYR